MLNTEYLFMHKYGKDILSMYFVIIPMFHARAIMNKYARK